MSRRDGIGRCSTWNIDLVWLEHSDPIDSMKGIPKPIRTNRWAVLVQQTIQMATPFPNTLSE